MLGSLPPFLIVCDIGSHFEIWEGFSGDYGSYGARRPVNLAHLREPKVFDRFVKIFTDPQALNPEKLRARVTREVAAALAKLSRWLEENPPHPLAPATHALRSTPTWGEGGQEQSFWPPSPALGEGLGERANLNDLILERLVALNAQRAEEGRSGLIRWLRPEYLAPEQAQPVQTALEWFGLVISEEHNGIAHWHHTEAAAA